MKRFDRGHLSDFFSFTLAERTNEQAFKLFLKNQREKLKLNESTSDPSMSEDDNNNRIEKIEHDLITEKIQILNVSIKQIKTTKTDYVILIGPIFDTDIHDTILQIMSTGACIADMHAVIATSDTPQSTVMFKLEYKQDEIHPILMEKLATLSSQKNLKYITS